MLPEVDGLILAGGRSTRFGSDKLTHHIGSRSMIGLVHDALSQVVTRVFVSVSTAGTNLALSAPHVVDTVTNAGPLAGLHAGLTVSSAEAILAVAGDMPYLRASLLRRLCDVYGEYRTLVVPRTPDGRLHPLCAVYPRTVLPLIEEHLYARRLPLHALLESTLPVTFVDAPAAPLRNVNEPGDLTPAAHGLFY